jgi:hypothetical protein
MGEHWLSPLFQSEMRIWLVSQSRHLKWQGHSIGNSSSANDHVLGLSAHCGMLFYENGRLEKEKLENGEENN